MHISIIGSGNIAHFLGKRLVNNGLVISQVYSPNISHTKALSNITNATIVTNINDVSLNDIDLLIVAVSDNATKELISDLPATKALIIYTSGSINLQSIFSKNNSENIACLWPIYSITKQNLPANNIGIPTGVVCANSHKKVLQSLCASINLDMHYISDTQKETLHLCATMLNNFTNYLMQLNAEILSKQNLSIHYLLPLLNNTIEKITFSPPSANQTGPAKRGDTITIEKHLDQLANNPETLEIYKLFTKLISSKV